MPRQARIDYPRALQHVIVRGVEGKDIFKEEYDKKDLSSSCEYVEKEGTRYI